VIDERSQPKPYPHRSPSAYLATANLSPLFLFTVPDIMDQPPESDKVKMLLSKEDKYLVIEYLVIGNDHTSEQCRNWHAANLDPRKSKCTNTGDRYFLKIKCDVAFQPNANGWSNSVRTMKKEDAYALSAHFFRLSSTIAEIGEISPWLWELWLEEEYEWMEWREAIERKTTARSSARRKAQTSVQ
jgi:hypothetical protein